MPEGLNKNPDTIVSLERNEWQIPTDVRMIRYVQIMLRRKLHREGWEPEEISEFLEFAVQEALVNAIAHGNLGIAGGTPHIFEVALEEQKHNPAAKTKVIKIFIDAQSAKDTLIIGIQNEGKEFDYEHTADPTAEENLKKTQGRGLLMMRSFSSSVKFEDGGRKVFLTKKRESSLS